MMYTNYFGLVKKPFSLLPDPDFLFLSSQHQKALSTLRFGLANQADFTVITGAIGTGKTTLSRSLLQQLSSGTTLGIVANTHKGFGELLVLVLAAFNIKHNTQTEAQRYQVFMHFLKDQRKKQRKVVLVIDEAQNLDIDTLEQLRLLSNLNIAHSLPLQIVLIGQTELAEKLNNPLLIQLADRIGLEYHLSALGLQETEQYIKHRLKIGGSQNLIFSSSACAAVYYYTNGIPRLINSICDLAMVFAFANESVINWQTIEEVIKERKIGSFKHLSAPSRVTGLPD